MEAQHQFKEAFCLMYYEHEESKTGFVIWNSRNGVTPFIVGENGKEYVHKHWGLDRPVVNEEYIKKEILKRGQRIFRDITEEEKRIFAVNSLKSAKGTKYEVEEGSDRWNELIESITKSGEPGEPTMVIVQQDGVMP